MSKILIKQRDITDCGAACLASVAAHYNLYIPVARIRQFSGTDKEGTTVLGLQTAANNLHFEAKGVKGSLKSLNQLPLPAIAHLTLNNHAQHYVVIYKITKTHILLMDPSLGKMQRRKMEAFAREWTGILLLLIPSESFINGNERTSHAQRFWKLIKPHGKILIQALFGAIIYTILGLSSSIFIQKITDHVLADGNLYLLQILSLLMIAILCFQTFIGTLKNLFVMRIGQHIDAKLILGYYRHLLKLPQQFFDTMRIGEIISRTNDAIKIRALINEVMISLIVNIMIIVFAFALMFTYYWKMACLACIIIPIYTIIYLIINKLNKKIQRRLMEQSAALESQLVESLTAIRTIKRFQLEEYSFSKTETLFVSFLKTLYASGKNVIGSSVAIEFSSHLLTIVLLWTGATYALNKEITPGELLSFYTLMGYFTGPAANLITTNRTYQDAIIASDRLFEIMDLEAEGISTKMPLFPDQLGDIIFKDVSFSYGLRKPIFDKLSLQIKKGRFTAIVGESGSGKSTLISLLQNIYPIQHGSISIGKYAMGYLDNSSIQNLISIVPQHLDLFSGNVIENIAIGVCRPNMEHIITICTNLGMMDFIESLPQGFQTYLGENGMLLSGGQKQRIAIARALYRQPEILILDEATSSLDSSAEALVEQTIKFLVSQQKTILIITHRLSAIEHADHIIVLNKGAVVEEGTHQLLLKKGGYYFNLVEKQLGKL